MRLVGLFFAAHGAAAAFLLVHGPFGVARAPNLTIWVLFPVCFFGGVTLVSLGSSQRELPGVMKTSGVVLLVVALAGATGLLADAAGLVTASASTWSLWYVFGIGAVAGSGALLAPEPPETRR